MRRAIAVFAGRTDARKSGPGQPTTPIQTCTLPFLRRRTLANQVQGCQLRSVNGRECSHVVARRCRPPTWFRNSLCMPSGTLLVLRPSLHSAVAIGSSGRFTSTASILFCMLSMLAGRLRVSKPRRVEEPRSRKRSSKGSPSTFALGPCYIMALIKMPPRLLPRQLSLPVARGWGGARPGAGRKPGRRPLVLHRARGEHKSRHPVHVTLRARREVGSLRGGRRYGVLEAAIAAASRTDFRVVHFSVQGDHVHLLVEARDKAALSSGLRGLSIRAARALNRAAGRSGPVWADRYHCRELASPREVRHALCYVLLNSRKHGRQTDAVDPCSSARWFDGWRNYDPLVDLGTDPPAVARSRTWLLSVGWRRHGLIRLGERPGAAPYSAGPAQSTRVPGKTPSRTTTRAVSSSPARMDVPSVGASGRTGSRKYIATTMRR